MEGKKIITLGDILDLLDPNRESNETVYIQGGEGRPLMSGPVCSPYWRDMEYRTVENIAANETGVLEVWLKEDEA